MQPTDASRAVSKLPLLAAALLLACAIILGGAQGGQGVRGEWICQLLALLLAAGLLFVPGRQPLPRSMPWLLAAFFLLPLLQIVLILSGTPGAGSVLESTGAALGLASASVVSVERSLWSLLPAAVMAWTVARLPAGDQQRLLGWLLALALASLLLGLLQRAQGVDTLLRLYRHTNLGDATGFFANRNHLACLLVMVLPLSIGTAVWSVMRRLAGHPVGPGRIALSVGLAVFLILGIALTRSRSGMVLCVLAILLSVPMVMAMHGGRGRRRVLLAVSGLGLLLVLQFAFSGILQRWHRNPMEDVRWTLASNTLDAAREHAPLGSGLGSFRAVYAPRDPVPGAQIVNHAHNDWLELWLEGGWPFLMLAVAGLAAFAWCGWRAWRLRGDGEILLRTRAAWIGMLLALLQAAVDYSLRTTANMVVFALLLAVLLSGLQSLASEDSLRRGGSRRG